MSVMQKDVALMDDNVPMEWDPFTDPQEGVPFFGGAGRAETVEQLQHLLRYGPGLVVLAGGNGVGKQTLVDHLLDQLDPDLFDVADLQANVMLSFQQLLTSLEEPWRSLHPITLDNYLELVPALASAADEESKTLLCLVRDAEQLDGESIADLKALLGVATGLPLKFLLVVGATEIEQAPHVRGLIEALPESHILYLDPLTAEQTGDYLRYRLQAAGLGKVTFNASQLEQIVRASGGIPGRINSAARELLLEAMPAQPAPAKKAAGPSFSFSKQHLAALGALVLVVLLFAFWGGEDESREAPEAAAVDPASNRIVLENAAQPVAETAPTEERFAEVGRVAEQSNPVVSSETPGEMAAEPGSASFESEAAFESEPPLETAPATGLSSAPVQAQPSASVAPATSVEPPQPIAPPVAE
ncbi:MAG TPA: hypothetical protein VM553_19250, partial [Dongiaceae bacterium]|nr:hypothetical protein [Dongiaceae bacterium]